MSYCEVDSFVPITDLVSRLKAFLPGVSPTIAEAMLREQATVFADRTKVLDVDVYEDAQRGVSGYPVTLPNCLAPRNIKQVTYNGACYNRIPVGVCLPEPVPTPRSSPCGFTSCQCGTCKTDPGACASVGQTGFLVKGLDWVELYPAPTRDGFRDIKITTAAGIAPDACDIPAVFSDRWGLYIIYGALSVLYGMKTEDWYNKGLIDTYREMAKEGVNEVKKDKLVATVGGDGVPIGGAPWVL